MRNGGEKLPPLGCFTAPLICMAQAFDEGWGGVICKTLSLDSKKVVNVTPRYAKLRDTAGKVFGWQVLGRL